MRQSVKMGIRWASYDWCPYKRREFDTESGLHQGRCHMRMKAEGEWCLYKLRKCCGAVPESTRIYQQSTSCGEAWTMLLTSLRRNNLMTASV